VQADQMPNLNGPTAALFKILADVPNQVLNAGRPTAALLGTLRPPAAG